MSEESGENRFPAWRGVYLLERIAARDEAALKGLYLAIGDRLYAMALNWLHDRELAKEAVQDTVLRIWETAARYDAARSQPFTWCAMILRGKCLDLLRKKSRRPALAEDLPGGQILLANSTTHDGLADILFHDSIAQVRQALSILDEEEREVVRDALFDPASNAQLAARWNVPLGTAKTKIHRAMSKLRTCLRQLQNTSHTKP
ncbi:RNA polymerase sigma factor [Roseibacillus persicicus]|nr:sigma-70 family RNA polymerase sigma factor [Roseibacillus persicicus]